MPSQPQSLAEMFGVNDIRSPHRVARHDLYSDRAVLPLIPGPAAKAASPSLCSRLGAGCDGFEAAIRAAIKWIGEGFVVGLALYACGEGLVEFGPLASGTLSLLDTPVADRRSSDPREHQRLDGG